MRVQDIKNEVSSRSTGIIPRPRSISSLPPPVPSRSSSRGPFSSTAECTMNRPTNRNENDHSDNSVPDAGSYERGHPTRRQSLDMQEKMTSLRRIKSSSFGSGDLIRTSKSQVLSNRKLLQRLKESSNRGREEVSVQNQGDDFDASPSAAPTPGVGDVPATTTTTIRPTRRAQSLRSHRPFSTSHRTPSLESCSTVEDQEVALPPQHQVRRKRRGLRRAQSSIVVSDVAATATVASESSKSSGSTNSSSSSSSTTSSRQKGLKRCTSLDTRLDRRVRGDQAPITPLRGPPSPITSDDSSASPPQVEDDFDIISLSPPLGRMDKAFKNTPLPLTTPAGPVVSTSRIKRSVGTKQRSKRLLKSLSESKIQTKDDEIWANDLLSSSLLTPSSHQTDVISCESATAQPSSSPTLPSTALGSPETTTRLWTDIVEMSEAQKANRRHHPERAKTVEKATKQRTFGFSRLARSFSSGGNKNVRRHFSATSSSYPVKNPAKLVDDSTRSDTERTASTVSTSQSDFSSLHSSRDELVSPSPLTSPLDPVTDLKAYSKLLSRLRSDFDLPPALEKGEYKAPRRPASMSSLMDHIGRDKMGTKVGRSKEDDDDDSTIVSNIDAPPVRTARSRSSSVSRRRMRREKMTLSALPSSDSKVVCFGNVNVREYERCVGDNPAVSSGVPIGLGWSYSTYLDVDVDIYESSVRKPGPRTRKDFVLTAQDRFQILRDECGISPKEILQARDVAAQVRYQRQVSVFGETGTQQLQTDSPPMYPMKRTGRGTYRRMRSTGNLQLPPLPLTDNRWGTSCPPAPSTESSQ